MQSAERQAINAPIQGTAADLIKLAIIAVQRALVDERRATKIIMQVHDELVLEVPSAELDCARAALPRIMGGVAELKVPLLAEVGVGRNWEEAHREDGQSPPVLADLREPVGKSARCRAR